MTIQSLAWAIDQPVPGAAKLVLLGLANRADHETGRVDFDAPTIASVAVIRESSLWRYLGALERNGYLAKDTRRTSEGELREYWLHLDRDPNLPWSWQAQDGEHAEDGESAGAPDPAPEASAAPKVAASLSKFRRADQDAKRKEFHERPDPNRPDGLVGVIEGSDAFRAWCDEYRRQGRVAPFVMTIVVQGRHHRGFLMPTLFPPRAEKGSAA